MPTTTPTVLDQVSAEKTKVSERLARLDTELATVTTRLIPEGSFPVAGPIVQIQLSPAAVRCELDLGEGGLADEIAAAPPGVFTCWRAPPGLVTVTGVRQKGREG